MRAQQRGPDALLQAGLADWLRALAGLLASLAGGLERRPLRVERVPVRAHPRSAENIPEGEQCEGGCELGTHRVRYPQFNSIIAGQKSTRRGGSAGASDRRVGIRAARAPPLHSNFDRYRAVNRTVTELVTELRPLHGDIKRPGVLIHRPARRQNEHT
jgi:hypothetical protein